MSCNERSDASRYARVTCHLARAGPPLKVGSRAQAGWSAQRTELRMRMEMGMKRRMKTVESPAAAAAAAAAVLVLCVLSGASADGRRYRDMFPHQHTFPVPFPIPGWDPDTNPWDESLYPPFRPAGLSRRHGSPPKVRVTSDSPAMNGSLLTFTAALEFPADGMEASAKDQLSNWTSWMEDYGFGKCVDPKSCNVFPDGKPFPQTNDWRQRSYVYVWHSMGQYFETCDGSSSHLTLNTTGWTFGAGLMEVLVYRKRERRKYSPLAADKTVYFITDKIPLAVNMSQKAAGNISQQNVFIRGADIVFVVQLHDPSSFLKTADAVDFIWDFRDGNQLVTHSNVATHAYSVTGNVTVKLVVEAAFRTSCPPPTPPPQTTKHPRVPSTTAPVTTPRPPVQTTTAYATDPLPTGGDVTSLPPVASPSQSDVTVQPSAPPSFPPLLRHSRLSATDCFRYMYGTFEGKISIVEPMPNIRLEPPSRIVEITATRVTNTTVNFLVTYLGSVPTSACTIVSDGTCRQVKSIVCDAVPLVPLGCQVSLNRTFRQAGTYCVNITLEDSRSMSLATTTVTISSAERTELRPQAAEVVLTSSAVLLIVFAIIGFMVYRRYKVYRPVRRSMVEDAGEPSGVRGHLGRVRAALFPANEERSHLLSDRRPL
ncbi:protein QNR-71-like isoform X2 [Denticeps clupeoides]|uniref:protein QNR-71-like isoform X2 n=1 Tax=Denticeps clupeoides TaxID=299321 RepID=UPI0010A30908|nr:protein QNR-71-like isoform X2 [Denticeps clupeoides]